MISAFFILNQRGEVLISRLFRPDLKSVPPLSLSPSLPSCPSPLTYTTRNRRSISDIFRIHVIASSTPPTSPLITLSNTTFFHVRHGGLWIVAVCKHVRSPSLSTTLSKEIGADRGCFESTECECSVGIRVYL